eukprot:TRINITY_DN3299_c0_g2_i2.p1 TRINITY_DN3299_c0_g2~~TRINITY_DN3299_c0_g2_i2.p1  ORF type:complete len:727 (-),score=166.99 TRINITY_DN3299_c0_g2_i2:171-2351(-)
MCALRFMCVGALTLSSLITLSQAFEGRVPASKADEVWKFTHPKLAEEVQAFKEQKVETSIQEQAKRLFSSSELLCKNKKAKDMVDGKVNYREIETLDWWKAQERARATLVKEKQAQEQKKAVVKRLEDAIKQQCDGAGSDPDGDKKLKEILAMALGTSGFGNTDVSYKLPIGEVTDYPAEADGYTSLEHAKETQCGAKPRGSAKFGPVTIRNRNRANRFFDDNIGNDFARLTSADGARDLCAQALGTEGACASICQRFAGKFSDFKGAAVTKQCDQKREALQKALQEANDAHDMVQSCIHGYVVFTRYTLHIDAMVKEISKKVAKKAQLEQAHQDVESEFTILEGTIAASKATLEKRRAKEQNADELYNLAESEMAELQKQADMLSTKAKEMNKELDDVSDLLRQAEAADAEVTLVRKAALIVAMRLRKYLETSVRHPLRSRRITEEMDWRSYFGLNAPQMPESKQVFESAESLNAACLSYDEDLNAADMIMQASNTNSSGPKDGLRSICKVGYTSAEIEKQVSDQVLKSIELAITYLKPLQALMGPMDSVALTTEGVEGEEQVDLDIESVTQAISGSMKGTDIFVYLQKWKHDGGMEELIQRGKSSKKELATQQQEAVDKLQEYDRETQKYKVLMADVDTKIKEAIQHLETRGQKTQLAKQQYQEFRDNQATLVKKMTECKSLAEAANNAAEEARASLELEYNEVMSRGNPKPATSLMEHVLSFF